LPEDLIFNINYLGSNQASFTFNFSKGASNIIAQYYVLIRLGKAGFTHIMKNLILTADYLAEKLENTGNFVILSERSGKGVPLVAFHLKHKKIYDEVKQNINILCILIYNCVNSLIFLLNYVNVVGLYQLILWLMRLSI
jgi:glutamate/tyrosine decarboxylase-like PLP-dependent enzyme